MKWSVLVGGDEKDEKNFIQAGMIAAQLEALQEERTTCKKCKKIFSEGYPYQKTMFGKVKNSVCKECAKSLGLI